MLFGGLPSGSFERRDGYALLSYPPFPVPTFNGVWTADDGAAGELEAALAEINGHGVVALEAPAAIAVAQRLGLIEREEIPGMLLRREDFAPVAAECDVERDAFGDAQTLVADAFGVPREWFDELYDPESVARYGGRVYVLREDGRAVSTAVAVDITDGVGIFNVATPTAERGRGLGAAVTSCAVADGFAAGRTYAFLQTSALGESVYRRLGFEHAGMYTLAFRPPH